MRLDRVGLAGSLALAALVAKGSAMYLTSVMVPMIASTVLVLGSAVIINS